MDSKAMTPRSVGLTEMGMIITQHCHPPGAVYFLFGKTIGSSEARSTRNSEKVQIVDTGDDFPPYTVKETILPEAVLLIKNISLPRS